MHYHWYHGHLTASSSSTLWAFRESFKDSLSKKPSNSPSSQYVVILPLPCKFFYLRISTNELYDNCIVIKVCPWVKSVTFISIWPRRLMLKAFQFLRADAVSELICILIATKFQLLITNFWKVREKNSVHFLNSSSSS